MRLSVKSLGVLKLIKSAFVNIKLRVINALTAIRKPPFSHLPFDVNQINMLVKFKPVGVIHVGGHLGQEIPLYRFLGIKRILLFEPQLHLASKLQSKYRSSQDIKIYPHALGGKVEEKPMYLEVEESANLSASSSFLRPLLHLNDYSHVQFRELPKGCFRIRTLDSFNISDCNLLVIDTQGYELEVLKGAESTLNYVDYVICEYWLNQAYEGVPELSDLVDFLRARSFSLVLQSFDRTMGNLFWAKVRE